MRVRTRKKGLLVKGSHVKYDPAEMDFVVSLLSLQDEETARLQDVRGSGFLLFNQYHITPGIHFYLPALFYYDKGFSEDIPIVS